MPVTLLKMVLAVEPDLQRLAGFALDAVNELGGNQFPAAAALNGLTAQLRSERARRAPDVLTVCLCWEPPHLLATWDAHSLVLDTIPTVVPEVSLAALATRLASASEQLSPALLLARNSEVQRALEAARADAAREMGMLEQVLERRKQELTELTHQAQTDALTGLYNRHAYEQQLRHPESGVQTLVLLDLDRFKDINDRHGHQYGDEYLRRMAAVLQASVRERDDRAFRIGGDEFAVIVTAGTDAGLRLAGEVLKSFEGKVSIGVAGRAANESATSWVGRADAALYQAKEGGRGQLMVAADPPPRQDRA